MDWPADRLGLNVPSGGWAAPALLKSFEAAGFTRAQVHAPPASVLSDPRSRAPHATALAAALATTGLEPVVHAPSGLRLGAPDGDRAAEGLLSYAAQIHDNLGARWQPSGAESGVDPLRPTSTCRLGGAPFRGGRLAPRLAAHDAPLMLEVHPPYRPRAEELYRSFSELLRTRGRALATV
jgi:hypothetical protein